jgi:hypothetical protein
MTPRRTVAVGLLTLVAVAVSTFAASALTGNGGSLYGHPLWHLLWGVLTVPIALGILFVRRAWPATGWTERSLVAAVVFALTSAAGNVLMGIGVLPADYAPSHSWPTTKGLFSFHTVGENLAVPGVAVLVVVCLVMVGVGVRGALRPRQLSRAEARAVR